MNKNKKTVKKLFKINKYRNFLYFQIKNLKNFEKIF